MTCFLSIASHSNAKQNVKDFAATLPNGARVELVGVSYHPPGNDLSQPRRWWRPDGSDLPDEPYRHPRRTTGTVSGYYAREFALRITGVDEYSCATYNSTGRSNIQPVIPLNQSNESVPDVLAFACRFKNSLTMDTIRVGVSIEPWQKIEEWVDIAWHEHDHDNIVFKESKNPLILTWPRQKGRAVILEMVRTDLDVEVARRLLLFDRDDRIHEESPRIHGQGPGLIKEQYWFWNIQREDMDRIELQTRPYQWIEFRNVSLEPGQKTNVMITILPEKITKTGEISSNEQNEENLGYILDKLNSNCSFPSQGRAIYEIEERRTHDDNGRVLRCEYTFHGNLYSFSVETVRKNQKESLSSLNYKSLFDGENTIRWRPLERTAEIREGRKILPVYKLERFYPFETIEKLLAHDVQVKGSEVIEGIPCVLLECTVSAKEKISVWVTNDPDIYPLRIERYEFDNLRYLYKAENVEYWNEAVFPEKTTTEWYRVDDAGQSSLISSTVMTIKSFMPNIEISPDEFKPDFPPGTSVSKYVPYQLRAAAFTPGLLGKRLPKFQDLKLETKPEQLKDKLVLVCFFDMNQRPSRNCIMQLAGQIEQLKQKDIVVFAVQASKIDEDMLSEWSKKNNIPFPVGMIQGDVEKSRLTWGVKSLPWLILTDREHVTRAEGFGINDLNNKIGGITNEP